MLVATLLTSRGGPLGRHNTGPPNRSKRQKGVKKAIRASSLSSFGCCLFLQLPRDALVHVMIVRGGLVGGGGGGVAGDVTPLLK